MSAPPARGRPRLVLATRNADKAREIAAIYAHLGCEFHTLDEWPGLGELPEDAATYAGNAASKARAVAAATGLPALADDSGIEIDALGGAPGPRSRRFLGEHATDADRNARVLALLDGVPETGRTARYRAVVAVARPDGDVRLFEGACEGVVARGPRGSRGFGYDPIFVVTDRGRTMAELSFEEKNEISHRARALRAAEPYLLDLFAARRKESEPPGANQHKVARDTRLTEGGAPRTTDDDLASGGRR